MHCLSYHSNRDKTPTGRILILYYCSLELFAATFELNWWSTLCSLHGACRAGAYIYCAHLLDARQHILESPPREHARSVHGFHSRTHLRRQVRKCRAGSFRDAPRAIRVYYTRHLHTVVTIYTSKTIMTTPSTDSMAIGRRYSADIRKTEQPGCA